MVLKNTGKYKPAFVHTCAHFKQRSVTKRLPCWHWHLGGAHGRQKLPGQAAQKPEPNLASQSHHFLPVASRVIQWEAGTCIPCTNKDTLGWPRRAVTHEEETHFAIHSRLRTSPKTPMLNRFLFFSFSFSFILDKFLFLFLCLHGPEFHVTPQS